MVLFVLDSSLNLIFIGGSHPSALRFCIGYRLRV